jgi:hypothetical protein
MCHIHKFADSREMRKTADKTAKNILIFVQGREQKSIKKALPSIKLVNP